MNEAHLEHLEQEYADRSGVPLKTLHAYGRFGAPCDCGADDCDGFQMLHLWDKLVDAGWTPPKGEHVDDHGNAMPVRSIARRHR